MGNSARLFRLLSATALFAFLLFGCMGIGGSGNGAGAAKDAVSLIPAKANGYIEVRVKDILTDADVKKELGNSTDYGSQLAKMRESGLDAEKINQAVIFFDSNSFSGSQSNSSGYFAIIINGGFDDEAKVGSMIKSGEFFMPPTDSTYSESTYNGLKIYLSGNSGQAFAFLGTGILAIGSKQAVRDAIDVYAGTAKPLNNSALESVKAKIDTNGWAYLVFEIPDETKAQLAQSSLSYQGISFESFKSIKAIGVSLGKKQGGGAGGSSMMVSSAVAAEFGSGSDASSSQKVLDAGRNLALEGDALSRATGGAASAEQLQNLKAILSSADISSSGNAVIIKYDSAIDYSAATVMQLLAYYASSMPPAQGNNTING